MTGSLAIVGLGPGAPGLRVPDAAAAIEGATDIVGYKTYVDQIPARPGQRRHVSDNRHEVERAQHALRLAAEGCKVALVSSGDPGIFAMASATFEAIEHGEPAWRSLDIEVIPGVSAMLAAAARIGAPLGHDFCVLSLSDNLKPWATVRLRLEAAAGADFAIAIYNPISRARPWQLSEAFSILLTILPPTTPVIFARAVSRSDERIDITTLARADAASVDMSTIVLIGSSASRLIVRPGRRAWIYTPRSALRAVP